MPTKRRARGTGSITFHRASGLYEARLPGSIDDQRRSYYHPTRETAERWLHDQLERHRRGLRVTAGRELVGHYLQRWHRRNTADPGVDWSPNTKRTYRWAIGAAVDLHPLRIEQWTRDATDDMLAELAKPTDEAIAPMLRRSLALIRTVLRSAAAPLVEDRTLHQNPVRRARRRRGEPIDEEPPMWSEDEARRFLTAAAPSPNAVMWWLAIKLGLRPGELRGLEPIDIDLSAHQLTVRLSDDGPTKGRRKRSLELDHDDVAMLRRHLAARPQLRGKLFQTDRGGRIPPERFRAEFYAIRTSSGVTPLRKPHDTRHVSASLMLANGYPLPLVAQILGHSSPAITAAIYAHVVPHKPLERPQTMREVLRFDRPPTPRSNVGSSVVRPPVQIETAKAALTVRYRSPSPRRRRKRVAGQATQAGEGHSGHRQA